MDSEITQSGISHQQPAILCQVSSILLEKEIKIVSPNIVNWFQENFKMKKHDNPFSEPTIISKDWNIEPLDLRTRIREPNSLEYQIETENYDILNNRTSFASNMSLDLSTCK